MLEIKFIDQDTTGPRKKCPMCESEESKSFLKIDRPDYITEDLVMHQCVRCGTGFFVNDVPVVGYNYDGFENDYWFNYVQNGAGISAMLEPIFALEQGRNGDLLDVGCGFGFVPHFWKVMTGNEAIGLEVSGYGKIGSEKLGINIISEYYSEADEIKGRKFQYVYSSEVLEHVENPEEFLREISAAVADDGILILTTPSCSALKRGADYHLMLATLSPGFHYFIASEKSLRDLLSKVGFENVMVYDSGHRLFAWASHKSLPKIRSGFKDWSIYLEYLEKLSKNSDFHVAGGALYRGLKDSFNLGDFDRASRFYSKFKLLARESYDLDFDSIERSTNSLRSRQTLNNEVFPSWVGCGLMYSAFMEERAGANLSKQLALLSLSIEVMQKEIELAAQFAGEPAHFIDLAKKKHQEVYEKTSSAGFFTRDPNQTYILRHPGDFLGRDVCLFAAYSSQIKLTSSVVKYIEQLEENGIRVVICLALDDPIRKFDLSNIPSSTGVVIRRNGGYDFCSWSSAIRLLPDVWSARRVFMANDSVFVLPNIFSEFIAKMRSQDADFVALTDSHQINYHSQSYFWMMQGAALSNKDLQEYISFVPLLKNKDDIIREYEVTLLSKIKDDFGLSASILFSLENIFPKAAVREICDMNVSHTYWDHLIYRGFPFVKVDLVRGNPAGANNLHWRFVFEEHGASVNSALEHVSTPRATSVSHDDRLLKLERKVHQLQLERNNMETELADWSRKWYGSTMLRRLSFHRNGRPRGWLRALLLETKSGPLRHSMKFVVLKKNGKVRKPFAKWYSETVEGRERV